MSIGTILLIVLVLMLLGVVPSWNHSRSWGYGVAAHRQALTPTPLQEAPAGSPAGAFCMVGTNHYCQRGHLRR